MLLCSKTITNVLVHVEGPPLHKEILGKYMEYNIKNQCNRNKEILSKYILSKIGHAKKNNTNEHENTIFKISSLYTT